MTNLSTRLRTVMLVGPRLADALDSTPPQSRWTWAARVQLAYRGNAKDLTEADSTQGIRVILQSPRPDTGSGAAAAGKTDVPYHSPQLLGVLAGPHPDFDPQLHFAIAPGVPAVRSGYDIRPDPLGVKGSKGIGALVVAPAGAWPMPQESPQIELPWLSLSGGSLPVLVDAAAQQGASPFGFLGLVPEADGKSVRVLVPKGGTLPADRRPYLRMEVQPSGQAKTRLLRFELVPEGIAFEASIANPHASLFDAPERIRLRLCLVHEANPATPAAAQWSLKLVAPVTDSDATAAEYGELNRFLQRMRNTLAQAQHTLALELDATRALAPVRWPLQANKAEGRLALPAGSNADPLAWQLLIDAAAGAISIAGDKPPGPGLTSTVELRPDLISMRGYRDSVRLDIQADRRGPASRPASGHAASGGPETIPGPQLHIEIAPRPPAPAPVPAPSLTLRAGARQARLRWFFDEHALARESAARYAQAGVLPAGLGHTWTFLPVRGGWLQWPLPLQRRLADGPFCSLETAAAKLGGELEFSDSPPAAPAASRPEGRQLVLSGADYITATAHFGKQTGAEPVLREAAVDFYGADGKANGILWHATASPTPEQILPALDAGPAALSTPWFEFGRDTAGRLPMRIVDSSDYRPDAPFDGAGPVFDLHLGTAGSTGAVAWQGIRGIPTITAMPMTRTSGGLGMPSSTRRLLPGAIAARSGVTLAQDGGWCPVLSVEQDNRVLGSRDGSALPLPLLEAALWNGGGAGHPAWRGVPLVAVSLPGVEFKPVLGPFGELQARLRYDLPLLDELFATARLPEARPAAGETAAPPEPAPTSLDLRALGLAWRRTRDALLLSRTQDAVAGADWLGQKAAALAMRELFGGASWQAVFSLYAEEQPGAGALGLGRYELAPAGVPVTASDRYAGDAALAGLSARFRVDGSTLERDAAPAAPGAPEALQVRGFAAALWRTAAEDDPQALWRDTRGALAAALPDEASDGKLVLRRAGRVEGTNSHAWLRATLRAPVPVTGAAQQAPGGGRRLAFWFCDLPLVRVPAAASGFDAAFDEVLAFRPAAGAPSRQEQAAGPLQEAFDADVLPGSSYEWRFTNDPEPHAAGLPALASTAAGPLYDIDLGAVRFRPLRLLDLTLARAGAHEAFHVARIVVLGTLARDLDASGPQEGFGPDRAYDGANAVALQLLATSTSSAELSFENATWHAAELAQDPRYPWRYREQAGDAPLRFHLPALEVVLEGCAGAGDVAPGLNRSSGWLELVLSGRTDAGAPGFVSATLSLMLFGRACRFSGQAATTAAGDLQVRFSFTAGSPLSGVALSTAVLSRLALVARSEAPGPAALPLLTLGASLQTIWTGDDEQLAAGTVRPLALLALDSAAPDKPASLRWLNAVLPALSVDVDHLLGLISVDLPPGTAAPLPIEPIAGMHMPAAILQARLRMVIASADNGADITDGRFGAGSALGELLAVDAAAVTAPAEPGPPDPAPSLAFTELRHRITITTNQGPPRLASEITLSLAGTATSRIAWPVGAIPPLAFADMAAAVSGAAVSASIGTVGTLDLAHTQRIDLANAPLPTSCLAPLGPARTGAGMALERPWVVHALVEHAVFPRDGAADRLAWTCLDHVVVTGARALVEACRRDLAVPTNAKDKRAHAFAARYRKERKYPGEQAFESPAFVKAGIGLRAHALAGFPVAAIAARLIEGISFTSDGQVQGAWTDSLVVNGAGPAIFLSAAAPHSGVQLSLPWIWDVGPVSAGGERQGSLRPPGPFLQAGARAHKWTAPDIDWIAGVPMRLSTEPATRLALRSNDAGELQRALAAALEPALRAGDDAAPVRALMPVEQVFLRGEKGEARQVEETPFWLRSLLALAAVWRDHAQPAAPVDLQDRVHALLVSGHPDARHARVLVSPPARLVSADRCAPRQAPETAGAAPLLYVLGRQAVHAGPLPAGELPSLGGGAGAARLRAIAEGAAPDPVIAVVLLRGPRSLEWTDVPFPADQDDPALHVRPLRPRALAGLFASPSLGWPTTEGVAEAAAASLGMGEDRPFQDPAPAARAPNGADAGTGFSGRVAGLSLPHRADPASGGPDFFYALGRKTIFTRPAGLPLNCPPARHLSPSHARARAPHANALATALQRVSTGRVAPIVPPYLERASIGLRPGAMAAEFDALFTAGSASGPGFDAGTPWLGRAAHGGPALVRQVRPPRSVALPRLVLEAAAAPEVRPRFETHGRRTFVALDDKDGTSSEPVPFRWFAGMATVLRVRSSVTDASVHLRLPFEALWSDLAPPGTLAEWTLPLVASSPSLNGTELSQVLVEIGLIRVSVDPDDQPAASIVVDRLPFRFLTAGWTVKGNTVHLRLSGMSGDNANSLRERLRLAAGDVRVSLSIVCARQAPAGQPPPASGDYALQGAAPPSAGLRPESCLSIVLPVLLRQSAAPSVALQSATLAFADPSYDRALSGPGGSDVQRDNSGIAWKLATDRVEYGVDTPLYLAFGALIGGAAGPDATPGRFDQAVACAGWLSLVLVAREPDGRTHTDPVAIANTVSHGSPPRYALDSAEAYSLTLDRLRTPSERGDTPLVFNDGDELGISVGFLPAAANAERTLSVRVRLVNRPVTPPPPAVYSLVCTDDVPGAAPAAQVLLHASNPLPQRIEFVDLLADLALGHLRRRALFTWHTVATPDVSLARATLVKLDRSGGGQLPNAPGDFRPLDPPP